MGKYDDLFDEAPKIAPTGKYADLMAEEQGEQLSTKPPSIIGKPAEWLGLIPLAESARRLGERSGVVPETPFSQNKKVAIDEMTPQQQVQTALDVLGMAGVATGGAAGAAGKIAPRIIGGGLAGAGTANALMDVADVPEAVAKSAQGINNPYLKEITASGVPAIISMLGGGVGAGLSGMKTAASTPSAIETLTGQRNIPITEGQVFGPTSEAAMRERAFKENPATAEIARKFYEEQNKAIQSDIGKIAREKFGDVDLANELETGQFSQGRLVEPLPYEVKGVKGELGGKVGAAREAMYEKATVPKRFAKDMRYDIDEIRANAANAIPGSDRYQAGQILDTVSESMKDVKTLKDAQTKLKDFDGIIQKSIKKGDLTDAKEPLLVAARAKIKEAMDTVAQQADPEAFAKMKESEKVYSKKIEPIKDIYSQLVGPHGEVKVSSPGFVDAILGGSKGTDKAKNLALVLEDRPEMMDNFKAATFQSIIKRARGADGIPTKAGFDAALKKWQPEALEAIFPEGSAQRVELQTIRDYIGQLEAAKNPLGTQAQNSHTARLLALAKQFGGGVTDIAGNIPVGGDLIKAASNKLARMKAEKQFQPYKAKEGKTKFTLDQILTGSGVGSLEGGLQGAYNRAYQKEK